MRIRIIEKEEPGADEKKNRIKIYPNGDVPKNGENKLRITIGDSNYYNDKGERVSKEESERERAKFESECEEEWERKVSVIVDSINKKAKNDKEKLAALYFYFTSNDMKYVLESRTTNGRLAIPKFYRFKDYQSYQISQDTKYPAVFYKEGICATFSKAFDDICKRLGIPCRIVEGFTGMEHAWNVVLVDNELKHIDIAFYLMYRNIRGKRDFFLKDLNEIIAVSGGRSVNSDLVEIEEEMRREYEELHPKPKGSRAIIHF